MHINTPHTDKYLIFEYVSKPFWNSCFFSENPPHCWNITHQQLPNKCQLLPQDYHPLALSMLPVLPKCKYLYIPSHIRIHSHLDQELKIHTNVPLAKYTLPLTQWVCTHLHHNYALRHSTVHNFLIKNIILQWLDAGPLLWEFGLCCCTIITW